MTPEGCCCDIPDTSYRLDSEPDIQNFPNPVYQFYVKLSELGIFFKTGHTVFLLHRKINLFSQFALFLGKSFAKSREILYRDILGELALHFKDNLIIMRSFYCILLFTLLCCDFCIVNLPHFLR